MSKQHYGVVNSENKVVQVSDHYPNGKLSYTDKVVEISKSQFDQYLSLRYGSNTSLESLGW